MELSKALIFVENFEQVNGFSIQNSINLAAGVSNEVTIVTLKQSPEYVRNQFEKYLAASGLDLQVDFQILNTVVELFEYHASASSILMIVIGDVHVVHTSVGSKVSGRDATRRTEIVSSDFARYQLLDKPESIAASIPVDTLIWLRKLKKKYGSNEIMSLIDQVKSLNVAVIGETILDEYIFTEALGKTSKDPMLAFLEQSSLLIGGGTLAVARHLSGLGIEHSLFTSFGMEDYALIKGFLDKYTSLLEVTDEDFLTIRKTRFIDSVTRMKLFELYRMKDANISEEVKELLQSNRSLLDKTDVIMLFDYGHGYFDASSINLLSQFASKVSANAQSNAGNRGFNSISKYRGFSSLFLNGSEVSSELRRRSLDLPTLVSELTKTLECRNIFITNGAGGLVCMNKEGGVNLVPAFTPHIVDRTGAGDALMTLTSLMLKVGAPIEIAAFFGNVAGATVLGGIGNQISLNFDRINLEIEAILHASESVG